MARSEITRLDWLLLVVVGLAVGLNALNETAIGLALPAMRKDLAMSELQSHWAVNAYLLIFAVCIAGAGKSGDVVGLKPLFLAGVAVFALGSAACGWATSGDWIIAGRDQRGEASGISLATQLLGATAGVAVASALLTATSSYWIIFAITAAITLVISPLGLIVGGGRQTE